MPDANGHAARWLRFPAREDWRVFRPDAHGRWYAAASFESWDGESEVIADAWARTRIGLRWRMRRATRAVRAEIRREWPQACADAAQAFIDKRKADDA